MHSVSALRIPRVVSVADLASRVRAALDRTSYETIAIGFLGVLVHRDCSGERTARGAYVHAPFCRGSLLVADPGKSLPFSVFMAKKAVLAI